MTNWPGIICFGTLMAGMIATALLIRFAAKRSGSRITPGAVRGETLWDRQDASTPDMALGGALAKLGIPLDLAVNAAMGAAEPGAFHRLANNSGAVPFPPGLADQTRSVLEDVALAAGLPEVPALFMNDVASINAWAAGSPENAGVGVTSGLLDALEVPEQRAVFAALLARVAAGVIASSAQWSVDDGEPTREAYDRALAIALSSDERGVMLTKDPEPFVRALEKTATADVVVPRLDWREGAFLWAWPGTQYDMVREAVIEGMRRIDDAPPDDIATMVLRPVLALAAAAHAAQPAPAPLPVERTEGLRLENLRTVLHAAGLTGP